MPDKNSKTDIAYEAADFSKRAIKEFLAELKKSKLSDEAIAKNSGVEANLISDIRNGLTTPYLDEIFKITHAIGVTAIMAYHDNNMNTRLAVKLLSPDAKLPSYGRPGDAGLDLHALEAVIVPPRGAVSVKTGVAVAIPEYAVGLIWPRSGLSVKHNIETGAGVIDCTYRGEIIIKLHNLSDSEYAIAKHDRVAQLLIMPRLTVEVTDSDTLTATQRGHAGFGSSGK